MPRPLAMILAIALAVPAVLAGTSAEAARPVDVGSDRGAVAAATGQRHADVVRYWTPARVASATPADVELEADGRRAAKGKPGSGGSTNTPVAGASWNGGGAVLKTTGKVLFTLGTSNYVCSASVVQDEVSGRSVAMTAGHCVFDDVKDVFATNWMFVPQFDTAPTFTCASTVYGCWTATALVTTTGWTASDFNYDIGFAVLGTGGKASTQLDDTVGAQAVAFNTVHPTFVNAFGYPAEGAYSGNDLVYCAGTDAKDVYSASSTTYSVACSMNGGSSGGPWFREFNKTTGVGTLTSVNSYTYRGVKNRMFGPYLGTVAANAFATAKVATTSTLS